MPPINLNSDQTNYQNIPSSTSAQTFVADNGNRVGLMIYNNSTANLYIAVNFTATTSDFSIKMAPNGYYEMPRGYYTDEVTGIWDAAEGSALVTEIITSSHRPD